MVKVAVILVRLSSNLNIFDRFSEKCSTIKFHENASSGRDFFHADKNSEMTKLAVAFRSFAKAPENDAVSI